jgi:hypothetical protein
MIVVLMVVHGATTASAHEDEEHAHPYLDEHGEYRNGYGDNGLVRNYVRRPLTVPKGTMRFFMGPGDHRMLSLAPYRGFGDFGLGAESRRARYREDGTRLSFGTTIGTVRFGSVYGITDKTEVGFGIPLTFGPGVDSASDDIPIWFTGEFFESDHVEVGLRATGFIPVANSGAIQVGIPLTFRKSIFRLDTGIFETVHFGDDVQSRLFIPARVSIAFVDAMYVGLSAGADLRNFDAFAIPLGFHVLFTLNYDKFIMDLGLSFTWPAFIHAFASDDEDPRVGADVEDSLGQILGTQGVDLNDFDVQGGVNLAISF